MNIFAILWCCLAVVGSVQVQELQTQFSFESEADSEDQGFVQYQAHSDAQDSLNGSQIQDVEVGSELEDSEDQVLTPVPTYAPTPDPGPWVTKSISHNQVKPFAQPEPVTISEKAGVKFKPQIQIRTGCEPYAAVNDIGETSGGLKPTGKPRGKCGGSGYGSQVYGRSMWFNGVWAIMYSWYFPKDSPSHGLGHHHDWEHAVVFIDNPEVAEPKILGCSVSSHDGYEKHSPCPWYGIDGSSLKVRYRHRWPINHDLAVTGNAGKFQDLIMWSQMTDDARRALNAVNFDSASTPMNDWYFPKKLEKAWPF